MRIENRANHTPPGKDKQLDQHSLRLHRKLVTLFGVFLLVGSPCPPTLESAALRSPFDALTFVQIEKQLRDPSRDAEEVVGLPADQVVLPLPPEVIGRLGANAVEYDSSVVTYLPAGPAAQLAEVASQFGLVAQTNFDRRVQLPWHAFEAGDIASRIPPGFRIPVRPVQGLYLIQFAYPIKEEWLTGLTACGVEQLAYFAQRTLLVRTSSEKKLFECTAVVPYISWADTFLNVDRVSPELLELESGEGWELHFAPGTDLDLKLRWFPPGLNAERLSIPRIPGFPEVAVLHARGPVAKLRSFVMSDLDLLSVTNRGVGEFSDEQQGQIVAGNHNGTAPVLNPRYQSWLNTRGLLGANNQQTVCVVDTGYDTGYGQTLPDSQRHPDLASPSERIAAFLPLVSTTTWDRAGHGTMVAGIIAAEGGVVPPSPYQYSLADPSGFFMGSGIAPRSKLAFVRVDESPGIADLTIQARALDFCRNSGSADLAFIANESWNERLTPDATSPYYRPKNQFTETTRFFDQRVLDANGTLSGAQPMTIVFSAGNDAYDLATGTIRRDSVASPALAKNVIAVGATTSYRPYEEPPSGCNAKPDGLRPPDQNALHIARVAIFSGRGKPFSPTGVDKLHQVRVKPDLVAPAVRIFSTVPFMSSAYAVGGDDLASGCRKSYPLPLNGSTPYTPYTYGNGTSFAAPVVTGVAALARKWFLDHGTASPSPSLIKAALIATADDLGPYGIVGSDPRPSHNYGWGRVNLNRLTDPLVARFYTTDNQGLAVATQQQRTWQRTVDNPSNPTFIVLVWSDQVNPLSEVGGNSQYALLNNLGLAVDEVGSSRFWRGNNFQENVAGVDTGYSYRFSAGQSPLPDGINNVEAIFIPANTFAAGQQLVIKVTGENVPTGTQKFALYAYNVRLSS
jgi:subtilisin family serine protease